MDNSLSNVETWWLAISVISLFNIFLWIYSVKYYRTANAGLPIGLHDLRYWQIWLSAVYVFVCAYRAFLPRVDVQRYVLYDSWLSNILLGRSFATIAELCFAIQWAIILYQLVKITKNKAVTRLPYVLVGLIFIAEIFSWYAVISTNYFGHVVEESLWAVCALIVVISLISVWNVYAKDYKKIMTASIIGGFLYVAYLLTIDVPMYYARWLQDELLAKQYLTIVEGLHDMNSRWIVMHDWQEWKIETIWMSLYFSAGVWFSIAFINAPGFSFGKK